MKLPWETYKAGADLLLFQETMHLVVSKVGKQWECSISVSPGAGGGCQIVAHAKTKKKCIKKAEKWLAEGCLSLIGKLLSMDLLFVE